MIYIFYILFTNNNNYKIKLNDCGQNIT